MWFRASGVCACFPFFPVCVPVLMLWLVSCVVRGGFVELFRLRRQVGHPGGGQRQLQDVWKCLLHAFKGAEEALLDAGYILFFFLGGGHRARP